MSRFCLPLLMACGLTAAMSAFVSAQSTTLPHIDTQSTPRVVGGASVFPDQGLIPQVPSHCYGPEVYVNELNSGQSNKRGLLHLDTEDGPKLFTPFMLGDFVGPISNTFSDVKIAEGESPRPVSRVFFRYNYFNNLEPTRFERPTETLRKVDLHRWTFGGEQAFADELFSLGLRIPFNTMDASGRDFVLTTGADGRPALVPGESGFTSTQFGNVSAIIKTVLSEDRQTGDLLAGGLIISFPSASSKKYDIAQSTVLFMQPWVGYIWNYGDFYLHGFSSVTAPLIGRLQVMMFNDVGVGYYAYRSSCAEDLLTAIVPTLELHVATPLKKLKGETEIAGVVQNGTIRDVVNLTAGTTLELGNRANLGLGVAVPVLGMRTFDFELLAQLNVRY